MLSRTGFFCIGERKRSCGHGCRGRGGRVKDDASEIEGSNDSTLMQRLLDKLKIRHRSISTIISWVVLVMIICSSVCWNFKSHTNMTAALAAG